MIYLIDGYNLMYAIGLATRDMPANRFAQARTRLLDWLADGVQGRAELRVIFDARDALSPSLENVHRGVRFRFAFGRTADDLIEELLEEEARPQLLTVVSNDGRVRDSARHSGCTALSCGEFIDWVLFTKHQVADTIRSPNGEKPQPTSEEVDELFDEFSKPKPKPKPKQ